MHQKSVAPIAAAFLLAAGLASSGANAQDIGFNVILSGQVQPGVYGQVVLGNQPPPPVVYTQPVMVYPPPQPVPMQPIYLHVPPGHARDWSHFCGRYNACGRPVYFVRSEEYEPNYHPRWRREQERERDWDRNREHGRGREEREEHWGHRGHDHDD